MMIGYVYVLAIVILGDCPCKCTVTDGEEKIQETFEEKLLTSTTSKPYHNVRLPTSIKPKHYNVFLDVNMHTKQVHGNATIEVTVIMSTKYFLIHAFDFQSIKGKLFDIQLKPIPILSQFEYPENQYHVIEVESEVLPGSYMLQYEYVYELKKKLAGFYQATYKVKDGKVKTAAVTQFQPTDARLAIPCFDEPIMRASFDITIGHEKEFIAISNMPIVKTWYDKTGKWRYDTFATTPSMSTYLLAFTVCQFASVTVNAKTKSPVKMTFYAPPAQISQIKYATKVASHILAYYETYYNVSYPLPKADMLAVPDFALHGMENWGLVSCRLRGLLYNEEKSSLSSKQRVATLIAHELAHQWFGNLVTMEWWSDLWLNEGFASYLTFSGVNAIQPKWKYQDFQVVGDISDALTMDAFLSSHPIYVKVNNPAQINEIFDAISYRKGSSILRMLDNFLGSKTFVKGLNMYLRKYSYKNARTHELWEELSMASHLAGDNYNVAEIMNTWVLQMGFPVVDVTRTPSGSYKLSQSRFLASKKHPTLKNIKHKSPYGYKWIIPFNYMTLNIKDISNVPKGVVKKVWLNMKGASINIDSNDLIIKGNAGQYGFFRVNYDRDGWNKIISILKNNHKIFDVKDRAGLIQDVFALSSSGRLHYSVALSLFDYIDKDTDYIPWRAVSNSIEFIRKVLLPNQRALNLFKKFIRLKVSNLYKKFEFRAENDFLKRYLQVLIAEHACHNGHKGCLKKTSEMFNKWMNTREDIPSDFKRVVYYFGVYKGDEKEWNFVLKQYLRTKIPSEKFTLLFALCGTQQPAIIDKLLHYTLNSSIIKSQDAYYVFRFIVDNSPHGRYHAWYFLKENWRLIVKSFSHQFHTLESIVKDVTSGFTTRHSLKQVRDFFTKERMKGAEQIKRGLKQSMEKIESNIEWIEANKNFIVDWLKSKVEKTI